MKTLTSKREIIEDYLKAKAVLIPLEGKLPKGEGWRKTVFNPEWTADSFVKGNYGVVLDEDDLIIDYDPRNDKTEGQKAYQNLVNYVGVAFDTYTVRTGSGGLHVYLKKPKGFATREMLPKEDYPQFSGIEFKTVGRQMVCPGSIHPKTKKEYVIEWKSPSDKRMMAPDKLLELIKKDVFIPGIDTQGEGVDWYSDDDQTVSRFVDFLAKQPPAVEGCGGDNRTFQMACRGRDFNLSPQKNYEILLAHYNPRCIPSWDAGELWKKVQSAYKYNNDVKGKWNLQDKFNVEDDIPDNLKDTPIFERDGKGRPKRILRNVLSYMMLPNNPLKDCLCYNCFTKNIEFRKAAEWHRGPHLNWTDDDAIQYKAWLSEEQSFEIPTSVIHEAALVMASRFPYHPVKDYLNSLKWDGVPRVEDWLIKYCGAANTQYVKAISEKVLVAAITRIFEPGAKFDYVLVLEGEQGIGKSTLVNILAKKWFGDVVIDPHNKDTVDALQGKWIVEISEMECTRRTEVNALKRFISCTVDRMRPAYARTTQDFPRQCIFIGTINPECGRGYLRDVTGNRRFWPVNIKAVNYDKLKEDVDQLWAEAIAKYRKGTVKLYMESKALHDMAMKEAEERYDSDPLEDILENYLSSNDKKRITLAEIMTDILVMPISRLDRLLNTRISNSMHRLGYTKMVARCDGKVSRCFVKEEMDI